MVFNLNLQVGGEQLESDVSLLCCGFCLQACAWAVALRALQGNGDTALMQVCRSGNEDIVRLILGRGDVALNTANVSSTQNQFKVSRSSPKIQGCVWNSVSERRRHGTDTSLLPCGGATGDYKASFGAGGH